MHPRKIVCLIIPALFFGLGLAIGQEIPPAVLEERQARTENYLHELELYLQDYLVEKYEERSQNGWERDYSNIAAYNRSVEKNRRRWQDVLNPMPLRRSGQADIRDHQLVNGVTAKWIKIPLGGIYAEGILAFPSDASKDSPVPLIIAQHGIGGVPEIVFEQSKYYDNFATKLLAEGYAVLSIMNLQSVPNRNRIERLSRLAGTSLPGIEFSRMQHLLDFALEDPRIDTDKVGMWGLSLGGLATMFWMPIEPRIKVGIVSAWFNDRRRKMAIPDEKYSCFLDTKEEHAFFDGWLTEFSDYDVVSLICPRPLLIQHGKQDGIAHWPYVQEEFDKSKLHYDNLGIGNRIDIDIHEGGHDAIVESGFDFLEKWLKN